METGFDPLGRATSLGQADGSAAILTYDRCGRPVEALDAEGALTLIERDPAGRRGRGDQPDGCDHPLRATTAADGSPR